MRKPTRCRTGDFDAAMGHVLKYGYLCMQYERNSKMMAQAEATRLYDVSPEQMIAGARGQAS